ncbi:MAG: hypothetical protein HS115_18045 [Spirochaetales bacterium]|nr:hypothetical protein [Spirochaetales bacterium]
MRGFVLALAILPLALKADHDFLQHYFTLPATVEMRVHDSGFEGLTGLSVIRALGPYRAVEYFDRSLRKLYASSFGDGGRGWLSLRDLEDPRSIPLLLDVGLSEEPAESAELLGRLRARRAIDRLGALLDHPEYNVRAKALRGLVLMESPAAARPIIRHGERILPLVQSPSVGHGAFLTDLLPALGWIQNRDAIPFLKKALHYHYPFQDRTKTHPKNAALALAMLGDRSELKAMVALEREYDAVRIARHPVALQRARAILEDPDFGEEVLDQGLRVELGGARILSALRIFAENGSAEDLPFLNERKKKMRKMRMDVVTGEEPPFGFGNYVIEDRNLPVLFDWAMAARGDSGALSRLVLSLEDRDPVVATDAARSLVLLEKKEFYPRIASRLRRSFARKAFDCKSMEQEFGQYDRAFRGRYAIVRLLGGHFGGRRGPEELRLLVALLNDCNVSVIGRARTSIRRYPQKDALEQLTVQFGEAEEWELYQLATMMEMLGPEGLDALQRLADDANPVRRSIARRALIRAGWGSYQKYLCPVGSSAAERDLTAWIAHRFERQPDILKVCR